jgi:hypothetical protein
VLAANDKPLFSLDPLPVLKQTLATCLGKLRALAVVDAGGDAGEGGGTSLLSTEDDRCLEEAQVGSFLKSGVDGFVEFCRRSS